MKILLIKTSSMGDIIHALPALTDAGLALPGIQFDWLVEKSFAAIPAWHPQVNKVIPVALRRWRNEIFSARTRSEWRELRATLKQQQYDLILDAQGLVKSAFLGYFAHGKRAGLNWQSVRESLASLAYQKKYGVNFNQHAVVRMRSLFALALGYTLPETEPDFGLQKSLFGQSTLESDKYLVFLHGTTWTSKQWPESYWAQLAELAGQAGYRVKISSYDSKELACAQRIAAQSQSVDLLPQLSISEMGNLLVHASGVVSVDTGLGHLAAALDLPTVSLYGSTNPHYTGALGKKSIHLAASFPCSPCLSRNCRLQPAEDSIQPACYTTLSPERVWSVLSTRMRQILI